MHNTYIKHDFLGILELTSGNVKKIVIQYKKV